MRLNTVDMEPISAASHDINLSTIISRGSLTPPPRKSWDVENPSVVGTPLPPHGAFDGQQTGTNVTDKALSSEHDDDVYPDGGWKAWLVVLGSFCFLFTTYGWMQTIGTVQAYLEAHQLSDFTTRDVGWIPGVFTALALLLGVYVGPIFDRRGPIMLNAVGTVLYAAHYFFLAECKVYWQFMLSLGLLGGIGAGVLSTTAMSIISNWFQRRRGLAVGLAMCGSAVGGTVMPVLLRSIFVSLGWAWSMRIIGFLSTALIIVGNVLIRPNPRLARTVDPANGKKKLIDLSAFSSKAFTLITVTMFAMEFVIFGATGLLPIYATVAGYPDDASFYVISVMNAASFFGRSLPGLAGDFFGPFNVLTLMLIFTMMSMIAVWLPFGATNLVAFYVFAAFWGFGTGSFLSLTPVCVGKTCHTKDFGRYFGTMYLVVSFSLFITVPLGGEMLQSMGTTALTAFYIGVLGLGGMCFLWARWSILGGSWTIKTKV